MVVSMYRTFDWTMTIVCVTLCFLPILILGPKIGTNRGIEEGFWGSIQIPSTNKNPNYTINDDYASHQQVFSGYFREINILFLGITLPALCDALLDVYVRISRSLRCFLKQTTSTVDATLLDEDSRSSRKIVRMDMFEKLAFLVGVTIQALFVLFPTEWNFMTLFLIQNCCAEANTILTVLPVLYFLQRTTQTFTPLVTTIISFILNVGCAIHSCSYLADAHSDTYKQLNTISVVFIEFALCSFVLVSVIAFVRFLLARSGFRVHNIDDQMMESQFIDYYSEVIVPGWHIVALMINVGNCIGWYTLTQNISTALFSILLSIQLVSAILVIVLDMRVRHFEITHHIETLDSKRDFVRFLSHEIRTPLSTASMGLELMATELASNGDEEGGGGCADHTEAEDSDENIETLVLIRQSVSVAVEIFDQLLSYDSCENQNHAMLQLLTFTACRFFKATVDPMVLQAKRAGVRLTLPEAWYALAAATTATRRRAIIAPSALDATGGGNYALAHASVDIDRRKMGLAMRQLMAHAIERTPSGGEVVVDLRLSTESNGRDRRESGGMLLKRRDSGNNPQNQRQSSLQNMPGVCTSVQIRDLQARYQESQTVMGRVKRVLNVTDHQKQRSSTGKTKYLIVEVSDSGSGFLREDAANVFNKLFTFRPGELQGGGGVGGGTGSGLAMALAKSIIVAHGGQIWVHSEGPKDGFKVGFSIPLSEEDGMIAKGDQELVHASMRIIKQPPMLPCKTGSVKSVQGRGLGLGLSAGESASSQMAPKERSKNDEVRPSALTSAVVARINATRSTRDDAAVVTITPQNTGPEQIKCADSYISIMQGSGRNAQPEQKDGHEQRARVDFAATTGGAECTQGTATPPHTKVHVLVVEDSQICRTMLRKLLGTLSCTVQEAEDGAKGLEAVVASLVDGAKKIDLVLCDSVMPVMGGPEAVKLMRERGFTGPILGCTGNTLPKDVENFKAHGVNDVLGKPVKMQNLKNFFTSFGLALPVKAHSARALAASAAAAVAAVET